MSDDPSSAASSAPPTLEELAALLPQYEMKDFLAQGGMGTVFLARQISLDRLVAIKVLPPAWGAEHGFAQRFQVEARSMAKLHHIHIVAVYDFGITSAGHLYLVMEYVEGQTLHEMIRLRRVTLPKVQALGLQLCEAVAFAHEHGILHRDIKPGNVLVNTDGQVKVADFGLARHAGAAVEEEALGTPDYAAPELMVQGALVDHRADIFALGILFQEMLIGQVPARPREPLATHGQFDPAWESFIAKATADTPSARFSTVREMREALARIGKAAPAAAPAVKRLTRKLPTSAPQAPKVSGLPWMSLLAVVVVLGVAGFWWTRNRSELEQAQNPGGKPPATAPPATEPPVAVISQPGAAAAVSPVAPVQPPALKPLASGGSLQFADLPVGHLSALKEAHQDMAYDAAFFPDQRHVATCGADGRVCVWDMQTGERVRSFGPVSGYVLRVAVSADGRWIAAGSSDYKVHLWSLDETGAEPPREATLAARAVNGLGFSQDGSSVLIGTSDTTQGLIVWDWQQGTTNTVPGFRQSVGGLELHPGGVQDAFIAGGARNEGGRTVSELWLGSLSRRSLVRQYPAPPIPPYRLRVSPDGRTCAAISFGRLVTWDLESGQVLAQSPAGSLTDMEFVDGGRLILCGSQDKALHLFETLTGAEVWKSAVQDKYCVNQVAVTADGRHAVSIGGARFGNPIEKDGDYAPHLWKLPDLAALKSGEVDKVQSRRDMLTLETSDPELWKLIGTMAQEWDRRVVQGPEAARKELDDKYLAALRRDMGTASPRDRQAYLSEISRVANRAGGFSAASPPALARLSTIYSQQLNLLPQKARTERDQLVSSQRAQLDDLEKRRAGSVAALRVQRVKEALDALEGEMVVAKLQQHFQSKARVVMSLASSSAGDPAAALPPVAMEAMEAIPPYTPRPVGLVRPTREHKVEIWPRSPGSVPGATRLGQAPADLGPVVALAVGDRHALALRPDGTVVQWGHEDSRTLAVPAGLDHVVAVAAGSTVSAALRDDGVAIAWNSSRLLPQRPNAGPVVGIRAAFGFMLLRHQDGSITYMGSSPTSGNAAFSPPAGLSGCVDVAVPGGCAFALMKDGTVTGWGKSTNPKAYQMTDNLPKADLTDGLSIAATVDLGFLLKRSGELIAWGAQVPPELASRPRFPGASRIVGGRPYTGVALQFQPGTWKFLSLSDNRYPIDVPTAESKALGCTDIAIGQYYILGLRPL